MALRNWCVGLGVLAWAGCGPAVGASDEGASESSSTGTMPSPLPGDDSSSDDDTSGDVPQSDDSTDTSESGEPSGPARCLELVGLPVAPGEAIEGFADFDGDGMRELVITDEDGAVSIFAADAAFGPWELRQSITGANRVDDIGDLDGDGRDDLLLGWAEDSAWWRAQEDGTLLPQHSVGTGWDDDRRVLVADAAGGPAGVAEVLDGELALAHGMGDGSFVAASVMGSPDADVMLVGPILRLRDGVVAPTRWLLECIGFCTDGQHVIALDDALVATPHYAVLGTLVDVADVDGTATPDAFTLRDGVFELLVDGTAPVTLADDVAAARLGDLDGDGILDLAVLADGTGVVRWGAGSTWDETTTMPSAAPDGVVTPERTIDIDGDGKDELVVEESGRHALVLAQPCE